MAKLNLPVQFIEDYMSFAKSDYIAWWRESRRNEPIVQQMIAEHQYEYEVGSSYVKIIQVGKHQRSVHSFIVNKAGKFPLGTILKAAGWKAPATNFGRGNLLDRKTWDRVRWTGVS